MDMQDKEFDKLFSQKLQGLEIEPSAKVWQGINENLGGKKHKKITPYLSIAASIIVLIAAGIVLMHMNSSKTKLPVKKQLAVYKLIKAAPVLTNKQSTIPKTIQLTANKPVHLYRHDKTGLIVRPQKREFAPGYPSALINNPQVPAVTALAKIAIKQPVAVDTAKVLAAITPVLQQPERSGPALTASLPPAGKTTDAVPVKKHKIHGIGDLLNVAIAAVDKRRDKIIEFSDNDGDGTSVSGVNLGIIKVKKEN